MSKTIRACLTLVLAFALCISCMSTALAADTVDPGQSKYCKYGSAESPCHYWFACNSTNKQHYCYCTAHTEDKEDKYAFVFMYGPVACTLSGDVCKYCEHDYSPEMPAIEILLSQLHETIERGREPFATKVSGSTLSLSFSDYFKAIMDEQGISSETLFVPTEYTLLLTGGSTYAYTGSPIKPVILSVSEYGPGSIPEEYRDALPFMISGIEYANNVNPGTATATVLFQFEALQGPIEKELSINFTITGDSATETQTPPPTATPAPIPEGFVSATVSDSGVTASGVLSKDATLTVERISTGSSAPAAEYKELFAKVNPQTHDVLGSYEVTLEGELVGPLNLFFPVGSKYDGMTLVALHQKKNGSIERLTGSVAGGKLGLVVNELSPFVILAPTDVQEAAPAADSMPKTGDTSTLALWIALLAVSAAGLSLLRRKTARG